MRANFSGFASVSSVSENEQRQVLANFTQANVGSVGNAKSLIFANVGNASNTKSLMQENISDTGNAKSLMQTNFSGVGNVKNSMFANVGRADDVSSFVRKNVSSLDSAMNLNALNSAKMQGNADSLNAMFATFANALNLILPNIAKTGVSSVTNTAKASILGRISLSLSLSR